MQRMTRTTWLMMATLASASAAMAQLATSVLTLRDGATPPTLLVREVTADGMVLVAGLRRRR